MDKFIIRTAEVSTSVGEPETAVKSDVISESCIPKEKEIVRRRGRKYNDKWKEIYKWIYFDKERDKVFCEICKKCTELNISGKSSCRSEISSLNAFVHEGFSNWKKALEKFKSHENSAVHKFCLEKYNAFISGKNIYKDISKSKESEMVQSRVALKAVITSLHYLAVQGLAIRGHTDELSNFMSLLKLRSADVPELESWLKRSKYKWCSHDILTELLSIMSHNVQLKLISFIKEAKYYAIMCDETADISANEQISICFRIVDKSLDIHEYFIGFYETVFTDSRTLFSIINDVLQRMDIPIKDCRGQCYDGANNVSGEKTGLQTRIKEVENRAIFVHCIAHTLNLTVQDGMQEIIEIRNFLNIVKDLIYFVSKSPKRVGMFKFQQLDTGLESVFLRPFCPTRWTLRVCSLKSVINNYKNLMEFLQNISETDKTEAGAKASGFIKKIRKHEFYFYLKMLISIFEKIEIICAELQKPSINFKNAKLKIDGVKGLICALRQKGFNDLWQTTEEEAKALNLEAPKLSRQRKIPRRIESSDGHKFETPPEYHRRVFYEVVDTVNQSLTERFQDSVMNHIINMENFLLTKINDNSICDFYGDDFNSERLITHRNMLIDLAVTSNVTFKSVTDVLDFLKMNPHYAEMLSEVTKFVKIFLTIPVTTCTAERSFSSLRRLKTYLRSKMLQEKLNNISILNIHRVIANDIDIDEIANNFISRTAIRRNTFAIK